MALPSHVVWCGQKTNPKEAIRPAPSPFLTIFVGTLEGFYHPWGIPSSRGFYDLFPVVIAPFWGV